MISAIASKNSILGLVAVAAGAYVVKSLLGRDTEYDFKEKVVLITGVGGSSEVRLRT